MAFLQLALLWAIAPLASHAARVQSDSAHGSLGPMPWASVAPKLKTGDLAAFHAQDPSLMTRVIKLYTWSDITHVAYVVVMRYDTKTFSWSVVAEQDDDTVLGLMEVAQHPIDDIVTGDTTNGFEISSLMRKVTFVSAQDKVNKLIDAGGKLIDHLELLDYGIVTFYPLKSKLADEELSKLQSIISCLHAVRTRYDGGMDLIRMSIRRNSGEDISRLFCSDFVAYVGYEMGWISPKDIEWSDKYSSKNFEPKDVVKYFELSGFYGDAMDLNASSAFEANLKHVKTEAEEHMIFPSQAPAHWLKRNLQYEQEVMRCEPSALTYLKANFPVDFQRFQSNLWEEIGAQRLWDGEVSYIGGNGKAKTTYMRLVALVNKDGSKAATIYTGKTGHGSHANNKLIREKLASDVDVSTLPPGDTFKFTFKIAKEDTLNRRDSGKRSFIVTQPGDTTYGSFLSSMFKEVVEWANTDMSRLSHIWVFPSREVDDLEKKTSALGLQMKIFTAADRANITHVLPVPVD